MDELERIKAVYYQRKAIGNRLYSSHFSCEREREISEVLKRYGIISLSTQNILDVGCGTGAILGYFLEQGVLPENLYGIDLLSKRIEEGQRLYPNIRFTCGNAEQLPYPDDFFDVIIQSTMFTSILDYQMKKRIATEIFRVLKPNRILVWHDYRFNNPLNPNVKGIGKREIVNLFPGCQFEFKLINLNPFIARPLARLSWRLCQFLEKIPILRTHWLVTVKKVMLADREAAVDF
jgi:SAM-dependent methyltransferase